MGDYFSMNKKFRNMGLTTRAIHCGSEPGQEFNGVSPVLDFSTTFVQPSPGQPEVFAYNRYGNPTRLALERQMASLEHANYAVVTNGGMSAHITLMNSLLNSGDHVLCNKDVYGGVQRYLKSIIEPKTNIEVTFSEDFDDITKFKTNLRPNTKIVWLETPTNPKLKVYDI